MVDEESKSKGDGTECGLAIMGPNTDAMNGFALEIENGGVGDGNEGMVDEERKSKVDVTECGLVIMGLNTDAVNGFALEIENGGVGDGNEGLVDEESKSKSDVTECGLAIMGANADAMNRFALEIETGGVGDGNEGMVDVESKSKGDVTECGLAIMGLNTDAMNGFALEIENGGVGDGNEGMVDEESKSKGDVAECGLAIMGPTTDAMNGFALEIENGSVRDGNSTGDSGDGLRTYKRRKHTKMGMPATRLFEDEKISMESRSHLIDEKTVKEPSDMIKHSSSCDQVDLPRMDSHAVMDGCDNFPTKNWRNFVFENIYKSLGQSEGGLQGCFRDALVFHPKRSGTTTVKQSVHFHEDRHKCSSQTGWIPNGSQNAANGHGDVMSNGSQNDSNHHAITELCQRAFFDIIMSEKFSQLCNLLFENFGGMKVESFFDISLINSRMKEGAYESKPTLFHSDIQQVWTKLQKLGTEIAALAKSLSDKSRTSYCKQVGGFVSSTAEDGKDKFLTQESDLLAKLEQTEAACVYKVCTCRRCGDEADGRDCLVCDSCEEMFHVSCIEPAVVEIPLKNWYCADCTANGIESPHENCVVCERLSAPRSPLNEVGGDVIQTNGLVEDEVQLKGGKNLYHCNLCRSEIENGEKSRVCGHPFCPHKYYHVRCLTKKQLKSYGPCWYCPSCLCRACLTDRDDDKIVLCDSCDQAYHIYCMQPPRTSIPRGKWFCRKCYADIQKIRKAKRSYENSQSKLKKRDEGKGAFVNLGNERIEKFEEALDKSGGMDMLLTAAKTLNY